MQRERGERGRSFIPCFIPQMLTAARLGQVGATGLEFHLSFPCGWQGSKSQAIIIASQVAQGWAAGFQVEERRHRIGHSRMEVGIPRGDQLLHHEAGPLSFHCCEVMC